MSEWKEYKLGEICARLSSGKNIKADKISDHGAYPVYGGNGLRGYTDQQNFSGSCAIIGRQGAYCGNVRYFEGDAYMTEHAVVAQGNELVNNYYLALLLSTMHLETLSGQSAQPGLAVGTLSVQPVSILPLPTQQRIASILSSLDAKIENNNKINAKLEEIAQNLFKEWFVDFGPFKNGKFVESELGLIPEGWRVGTLGEIAQANRRTVPKGWSFYNYLDTGNITSNKIDSYQFFDNSENLPSRAKRGVADCDILYSTVRPEQRHYGLILNPVENMVASTGFAVITPNDSGFAYYIYSILTQDDSIKILQSIAEQSTSTYPSIKAEDILNQQIIIPSDETIRKFAEISSSFYCKIDANNTENKQLATLRDTLLPKLMSGEIEV